MLLCAVLPLVLLYLCYRHKRESFATSSWKFLYSGLRTHKGLLVCAYYGLFVLRRLFYALTLIFLDEHPLLQGIMCSLHSILVGSTQTLLYLLLCRPAQSQLEAVTAPLSELCLVGVFTLTLPFNFSISSDLTEALEITVMACIYVAISIPCLAGSIRIGLKLRTLLQSRRKKYAVHPQVEVGAEKLPVEGGTEHMDTTLFAPTSRTLPA